jgi:hypothetical protein
MPPGRLTWLALIVVLIFGRNVLAQSKESALVQHIAYRTVKVDGLSIFYREAGPKDAPTLLLLHLFPSSSLPAASKAISRRLRRVLGLSICHQRHYRCGTI